MRGGGGGKCFKMFAQHFDLLLGLLQKPNAIKWTYSEAETKPEPDVFDVWPLRRRLI